MIFKGIYLKVCFYIIQSMFFFLVQSEQGDLFKITLEHDEDVVSNYDFLFNKIV